MSSSEEAPPARVLERARADELGEFERRMRRRPGIGGALACLVILVVWGNFVINGPDNFWGRAVVVAGPLIILIWCYVWFRRVRGGLFLFSGGFIDAAGRRLIAVPWSHVQSITGQKTQFAIGALPAGSAFGFEVGFTGRETGSKALWTFNTTYGDVRGLAEVISARSGVPVTGITDPHAL